MSCAYLCRAAARNFTASQKAPRQYRTNLTSISHRGSPSVASPLRHHCYGLNPCYHGLIGCALLHIWLSITLMGCSNTLMGYPPPHPSTSSWLRCASDTRGFAPCLDTPRRRSAAAAMAPPRCGTSPVLCRGINGLCHSVAVTCCAPLIKFIDHCCDAPYIIYNKNLFPPATQVTCCAPLIKFIDHCCDAPYIIYNKNLFPPATQVTCRDIKGQTVPRHRC